MSDVFAAHSHSRAAWGRCVHGVFTGRSCNEGAACSNHGAKQEYVGDLFTRSRRSELATHLFYTRGRAAVNWVAYERRSYMCCARPAPLLLLSGQELRGGDGGRISGGGKGRCVGALMWGGRRLRARTCQRPESQMLAQGDEVASNGPARRMHAINTEWHCNGRRHVLYICARTRTAQCS